MDRVDHAVGVFALLALAPLLWLARLLPHLLAQGSLSGIAFLVLLLGASLLAVSAQRMLAGTSKGRTTFSLALVLLGAASYLIPFVELWVKLPSVLAAFGGVINAFRRVGAQSGA